MKIYLRGEKTVMTEVLFILIAIIVAYVIYVIVSEQKTASTFRSKSGKA